MKKFNKTLAIALAAGVSLGGVTVPQFAGVDGIAAVASAETGTISPTSPFPEVKGTMFDREYKFSDAEPGSRTMMRVLASPTDIKNGEIRLPGLFAGIPDDKIRDIEGFYNYNFGNGDGEFVRGKDYPQQNLEAGDVDGVKSVRVEENGDFVISLSPGAKRFHGVIQIILSDLTLLMISPAGGTREAVELNYVTKNPDGTISGKLVEQDLSHLIPNRDLGYDNYKTYGFPMLGQEPGVEVEPHGFFDVGGTENSINIGGVVARIPGQGTWEIDNEAGTITFTPEAGFNGTPIFPRIGLVDPYNVVNLVSMPQAVIDGFDVTPLSDEMGQYTFVDMQYVMPEEYRDQAEKDRDFNPNTPDTTLTEDLHVTDVKKDKDGNYVVTRNDGTKWTINLKDIRDKIAELEKNKADKTEVAKLKKELDALETTVTTEFKQVKGDITQLKSDITNLKTQVTKLEKRVGDLEKKQITKVVGDKGKYTLVREDGSVVEGVIDTSSNIVSIKDNGDGSVTITRVDGSEETVKLTHTKVVEDKKKNTVTITTPGGKPVVINTFDTFISDVKKQDNGDYLVTRNDGKSWTISTSELQKQIDDLDSKLDETNKDLAELKETAASKEEVAKLKEELDKHTEQLADHEQRLKELETNGATKDDIAALEKEIADNKAAIDGITEQISTIVTRVETLEKGVADNAAGIEGLKKDLGDVVSQVDKNTGDIATNGKDIADLREKVVTNTQEIMDLKEKAATKEQLLEVVKQVENHEKRITDLENQGASKEELAKTQAELDELKNKLAELENKAATKADVEKLTADIADHADKIAALETETAELNSKLVELTRVVEERFEKVTERISALETRADETDKALVDLGNRVTELEVSIQNIKVDITKLGDRVSALEAKVTDLTKRVESLEASDKRQNEIHDAWAKCYSGASVVGIAALLAAPLLMLASGAGNGSQMNMDIQKQLGIFNPEMAKWMAENQSVLNALGAVAGLAATIGLLSYAANQCSDYNHTKEVQKTPIGQLSSKVAGRDNKPVEAK